MPIGADGENDDVGIPGGGDCGRNVRGLGRHHSGAGDGSDLGVRQELSQASARDTAP